MTQETNKIAIYPLFNFQASEELADKLKNGFHFSNKAILRQIRNEEIDRFRQTYPYFWRDGAFLITEIRKKTFVFEIRDNNRADLFVYEILLAMRLYKSGSIFCKLFRIEDKTKTIGFGSITPPVPTDQSTYLLSINELEEIDGLVNKINKLNLDKNNAFRVACERFSRSYEERREDDKIIDLAIAFEALFTDRESRLTQMGKFVGVGCSMLIGKNTKERKEIKQFMEQAFSKRNDIVHSNDFKPIIEINGKKYWMNDFVTQFQKYLRDSIKKLL